jgi:hypothetical protein
LPENKELRDQIPKIAASAILINYFSSLA